MGSDGIHQSNLLIITAQGGSVVGARPCPAGLRDLVQRADAQQGIAHCRPRYLASRHPGTCPGSETYRDRPGYQRQFLGDTPPCQSSPIPNKITCFPEARSHGNALTLPSGPQLGSPPRRDTWDAYVFPSRHRATRDLTPKTFPASPPECSEG